LCLEFSFFLYVVAVIITAKTKKAAIVEAGNSGTLGVGLGSVVGCCVGEFEGDIVGVCVGAGVVGVVGVATGIVIGLEEGGAVGSTLLTHIPGGGLIR
jgi:hypothetical protein